MIRFEVEVTFMDILERPETIVPAPNIEGLRLEHTPSPTLHFYRYLYNAVGRPHVWTDRLRLSDDALQQILADPKVEVWVLSVQGTPAGYIELDFNSYPDQKFWSEGTAWISYFGLIPDYHGRGLGRYLLSWGIQYGFNKGASRLALHTNSKDHPLALHNYKTQGFFPRLTETGFIYQMSDEERLKKLG